MYSSTLTLQSYLKLDPLITSRVVFSVSSLWMTANSCIYSKCSFRTYLSSGVTPLRKRAGLPAQISPSLTSDPSTTTAPAATNPPECTVACLTVAPIATQELSQSLDPCKIALGPTNTLLPIFAPFEMCTLSCKMVLFPTLMGEVPMRVAPYQTEELVPTETSPRMVALGATKLVYQSCGYFPSQVSFLRLGVSLSSLTSSPSILFPIWYSFLPAVLRVGPIRFWLMLFKNSQRTTLINLQLL